MSLPPASVCLYADGAQNPTQFERGIPRYVIEHARALAQLEPGVLHSVALNRDLPLTGNLNSFLGTGLLGWSSRRPAELPLVYHIMSPFESTPLPALWPEWARDPRVATVVTLYDLIPLIFSDHYLRNPRVHALYHARLDLIRHADQVLALSRRTGDDAVQRLGVAPDRVHVIHAGASPQWESMYPSRTAAWAHLQRHLDAVRPGFMLYVGGFDFRKNLAGTIAGYGRLPSAVRARHQLVIACRLNDIQAALLREEAERAGVSRDQLVLTGYVSDTDLGALYHACTLFVFPSLYEGSGLPMLEAMSCGAPVAASSTATTPEILGDSEATFDPHDPASMAACLDDVLRSPDTLERLRARSLRRAEFYTWQTVAQRTLEGYERSLARPRVSRSRRPRLALVTPWPPEPSRAAVYSVSLSAALAQRVDVDVVVAQAPERYAQPRTPAVRLMSDREFEHADAVRCHDRVLYCMASSPGHRHVYELAARRPGAVVLHDVRLTPFYLWLAGEISDPGLEAQIMGAYSGRLPGQLPGGPSQRDAIDWGVYMSQPLRSWAEECFVHSRSARDVLQLEPGHGDRRVSVMPLAIPARPPELDTGGEAAPLVLSTGPIDERADLGSLIAAFARLAPALPGVRLVVADQQPSDDLEHWRAYATEHAPQANIAFSDEVSDATRAKLLDTADVAVQLRRDDDADGSFAVADCLSYGIPTIVTEVGWPGELPDDAVVKVPVDCEPAQLCRRIRDLFDERHRRLQLSQAASVFAAEHDFERVAAAYLEALGLG